MADVAEVKSGSTPKTSERSYWGGDVPWITPKDLSTHREKFIDGGSRALTETGLAACSAQLLPTGTVLFSTRAPIGYVSIAARPMATNQGFKNFICGPDVTNDYVYWYLKGAKALAESMSSGTTFLELSGRAAAKLPIPVPPIQTQQMIVQEIEKQFTRLDSAVGALHRTRANLNRYRSSVINSEITGRSEFGERHSPGNGAGAASIPIGWQWCQLQEIAEVVGGVTRDAKREADKSLPEVSYLRVANVQRGRLDLREVKTTRVAQSKLEKLTLRSGDVLLNEGGDRDKLGRGWVWEGQVEPCIHQNHVFRARPNKEAILPKYLSWYANEVGRTWLESRAKQTVNLASISMSSIKQLPVPIPPIEIQHSIVERLEDVLSIVDKMESEASRTLDRSSRIRQAILSKAFSGQLIGLD